MFKPGSFTLVMGWEASDATVKSGYVVEDASIDAGRDASLSDATLPGTDGRPTVDGSPGETANEEGGVRPDGPVADGRADVSMETGPGADGNRTGCRCR